MKIGVAQTKPIKGNIVANIEAHKRLIDLALRFNAAAIFFPELSLTGYEPTLANPLAIQLTDSRLNIFQQISDQKQIIIGLGVPTINASKCRISMLIFEPTQTMQAYSKQQLHSDEYPYFDCGTEQVIIKVNDAFIAPAICYESLQPSHVEKANKLGANIYIASVAKSANGVNKAYDYFPQIAKQYNMPVLMANSVGFCDDFLCVGKTAVWSKSGNLIGQLNDTAEGVLIFDTETEAVITI